MASNSNTDLNNDELMELIRQHTCIYEKADKDYRDRNVKSNAWRFIAEKLGCQRDDCQTRYKTIRTRFTKYLASLKLPSGSGATAVLKPQFEGLRWLIQHVGNSRDTVSNYRPAKPATPAATPEPEPLSDDSESESEVMEKEPLPSSSVKVLQLTRNEENIQPPPATPVSKHSNKRKRMQQDNGDQFEKEMVEVLQKERSRFSDPDTLFCVSLVGKFKDLRPDQKDAVQIEILQAFQRVRAPPQPPHLNTPQYGQQSRFPPSQPTNFESPTSQPSYNLSQHLFNPM